MFHSIQHDQLEGLRSRQTPLLNLFVNFPFGNHAMLPAVEQAFRDVSCQERSYREPRIPSFASSATPSKSGVELTRDPPDGSSCERKGGKTSKPVADRSWSASSRATQERLAVYGEDESRKVARKVRPASQGNELQVSVRNETASRERKSVFRRLSRPVSVFERLSSSPTSESYGPYGDLGPPLPGMIVGCTRNSVRKFMDLKIFGQPVARQNLVLRVVPGTKLFLFNYHTKELYGVYEATSCGVLRPETLVVDSKDLLAQVSWKMWEKWPNLHISVFRVAIEENFVNNKFKFDLSQAQVESLVDLFKASAPAPKLVRRKVECVPPSLERVTKRPRRSKDNEGGTLGGLEEEVDKILGMESYARLGVSAGGKHPVLAPVLVRSLSSLPKNHPRPKKFENDWLPAGLSIPPSASSSPASALGCVGAENERKFRGAPSFAAESTCRVLLTPERSDSSAAAGKLIGKVADGKRAGRRMTSEDERRLSCQGVVHGREHIEHRLPRCTLALSPQDVNRVKACWAPDRTDSVRSQSVKATRGALQRHEDNFLVFNMDSSIKDAGMKLAVCKDAISSEKEAGQLNLGTCEAGHDMNAKTSPVGDHPRSAQDGTCGVAAQCSAEQMNLDGSTGATLEVVQSSPTRNTPEQLGAFLRFNYLSAESLTPEIASKSIYHLHKPSTDGFMSEFSSAAEPNLNRKAGVRSVEVQHDGELNLELKFAQSVSTPGFGGSFLTKSPTLAVAELQNCKIGEDWASSAATELPFFQHEICKSEPVELSYHCPSPAEPIIGCKLDAEGHEFMCVAMLQLDQSQSALDKKHGRGTNCAKRSFYLTSEKEGQAVVDHACKCPTTDVGASTSIGCAAPSEGPLCFVGLDLNRPAFEDDVEFLEVDKDGLEADFGDGDDYMEDQPSESEPPRRTLEDLKPMKLLSNFRAI